MTLYGDGMKRKQFVFIIIVESLIILSLAAFFLKGYKKHQHTKELFINEIYFLLTDISNNLSTIRNDDSLSFSVYLNLTRLDTICEIYNQETRGTFNYNSPGIFGRIVDDIYNNVYNQKELTMMTSDIEKMIKELSDNSGIAENSDLSYEELNNIFNQFYNRWGN